MPISVFMSTPRTPACAADYQPSTLAWGIHDGVLWTTDPKNNARALRYDCLILATGAIDRLYPVRGWTLPGVFALGGAQVLLKREAFFIGRKIIFCGSSPLLYLAALQYLRLGAEIAAVIDTTPFSAKVHSVSGLCGAPGLFAKGLSYIYKLYSAGVPIVHGATLLEFVSHRESVAGVRFLDALGKERTIECDGVAVGYGLRAEAQLADLAGCRFPL